MSRPRVAVVTRHFNSSICLYFICKPLSRSQILQTDGRSVFDSQVTGANKGIGFGVVKELCQKFDGLVYLTSRDEGRGKAAVEQLAKQGLSARYHQLDIDDESSVIRLRDFLVGQHGGLDVLVNNACIIFRMTSAEPFAETVHKTIRTNFFHTLRASDIMLPIVRTHGRVVNLTSDDGHLLKITGQEPQASQLRARFAAPDLTVQQLSDLMNEFIEYVTD